MEDVLDLYAEPYDPQRPQVCLDESPYQLLSDVQDPLPVAPGQPARVDYEYEREGHCNLFIFFEPRVGWRHIKVTDRRTAQDFAHCLKDAVDVHWPDAEVIRLVTDNLNTHTPAALYETFPAEEARRITRKLEWHYTPKHGSWSGTLWVLAEIELSVLSRQCLDRRIPDQATLIAEVAAWEGERNGSGATVNWRFTTADARIKLKHLYPSIEPIK